LVAFAQQCRFVAAVGGSSRASVRDAVPDFLKLGVFRRGLVGPGGAEVEALVAKGEAAGGTINHGFAGLGYQAAAVLTGLVGCAESADTAALVVATFLALALGQTEGLAETIVADGVSGTGATDLTAAVGAALFEQSQFIDTLWLAGAGAGEGELTAGVFAKSAAAVAPVGDPAATIITAVLDRNCALIGAEHEGRAITAADIGDIAATRRGNTLASLALGACRTEFRG
jgi:hypothetical protein